jgi:hypothetical protein
MVSEKTDAASISGWTNNTRRDTMNNTNTKPMTFWKALKTCWNLRFHTTLNFEWVGPKTQVAHGWDDPKTTLNGGYWGKWRLITTNFPVTYKAETHIRFAPLRWTDADTDRVRLAWPWHWLNWDSEHIAALLGRSVVDGPFEGYGTTYHYNGWLGNHHVI